jgi:hypothetical protein
MAEAGNDSYDGEKQVKSKAAPVPRSVLEVIAAGKWKSAFFTTYTLSLTYVESHLLPALRRSGCDSLIVLADIAGYRDSLTEQRSQGVGRDYSVLPVKVASGIFHPKLAYFEGEQPQMDILLVGSGNLTHPGHGGSIEVLEVLRPSEAARAFTQCAEFLDLLSRADHVQVTQASAWEHIAGRMRAAAATGGATEDVDFVHCLSRSAQAQMLDAARRWGGQWRELLVLSPYHHHEAQPILQLAEQTGVTQLVVGVPCRSNEPSAFPFAHVRLRFQDLRIVQPVPQSKPQRRLHAKWFELRGQAGALVLTGSFNATATSFASTDNVEVGVLRRLPQPSACWAETQEPAYEAGDFPLRLDAKRPCVFAVLSETRQLQGVMLASSASGPWDFMLESADEILLRELVELDEAGRFSVKLGNLDTTRVGTLQVTLQRDQTRARGWVQISQVLRLEVRSRRIMDAVCRAVAGFQTAEHAQALLDIIAQEASRQLQITSISASKIQHDKREVKHAEISGAAFAALSDYAEPKQVSSQESLLHALNAGARGLDLLDRIMDGLLPGLGARRDDHPEGSAVSAGGHADHDPFSRLRGSDRDRDDDESEGEHAGQESRNKKTKQNQRKVADVYEALHTRLRELNDVPLRQPALAAAADEAKLRLLMVWLGTALVHQVGLLGEADAAIGFLRETWMREVCRVRLPWGDKAWMARHVCGVAAACAHSWRQDDVSGAGNAGASAEFRQATHPMRELHRRISAFYGGDVPFGKILSDAQEWLEDPRTTALVAEQVPQAVEALREVLSVPTERQILLKALDARALLLQQDVAGFSPEVADLFRRLSTAHLSNPPRVSFVDLRRLARCPNPHCSYPYVTSRNGSAHELDSDINWRLKKFGAYQCRCGQFLVAREAA